MFGRINIDFSRFQTRLGVGRSAGGNAFVLAGSLGAVSALLAGACVAPVVISVLLLASTLHNQGTILGLALPFVLGLGMALPWPFAGAGLSFLPKPGKWMEKVKYAFGIFIFVFAAWYGYLGLSLTSLPNPFRSGEQGHRRLRPEKSLATLHDVLAQSRAEGKPVFIDFWATWCKNCSAMEYTHLS